MRDNYIKLIDFSFGKYLYTVMKNNDKILYFEVVNNKYVQPISSFNLYDNEGKSLTSVNQHFFMNQLINRINVACKKGIFINEKEIYDFLNKIKSCSNDNELNRLFKGSYMSTIDEYNFEDNKRSIIRYLDKFKIDTYIDYSNVSIFNGSLEKSVSLVNVQKSDNQNVEEIVDDSINEDLIDDVSIDDDNSIISNGEVSQNNNSLDSEIIDIDDSIDEVPSSSDIDFMNIPVDNSLGNVVNSNDYFSASKDSIDSVNVQNDVNNSMNTVNVVQDNTNNIVDMQSNIDSVNVQNDVNNGMNTVNVVQDNSVDNVDMQSNVDSVNVQNDVNNGMNTVNVVQDNTNNNVDLTKPLDFNALYANKNQVNTVNSFVENNGDISFNPVNSFDNEVIQPIVDFSSFNQISADENVSNDGFSLSETIVQNSVNSNEATNNGEGNNVYVDKVNMPKLDDASNEEVIDKKKSKPFKIIIIIFIIIILLGAFAYFLYNYIF